MPTILVIDDDHIVREAIRDILDIIDVNVIDASNGADGAELFSENFEQIDGIILDRRMPRMDGIETMKVLRQINPSTPIIMSSGFAENKATANLNDVSPDAYLYKPYEIQDLINMIQTIVLKE
ncbi:MAG: response regulator [Chloroflexota bacterium]